MRLKGSQELLANDREQEKARPQEEQWGEARQLVGGFFSRCSGGIVENEADAER